MCPNSKSIKFLCEIKWLLMKVVSVLVSHLQQKISKSVYLLLFANVVYLDLKLVGD